MKNLTKNVLSPIFALAFCAQVADIYLFGR